MGKHNTSACVDYKVFFDEFKEECLQYPANYEKIENMLKIAGDINSFPYDEEHNFLSDIIHWSVRTNPCDMCTLIDYDNMSENEMDEFCDEHDVECEKRHQELLDSRDGRYVPHIVELILKQGFDTSGKKGVISRKCWMKIAYSTFDKYMLDIAKVLLKYNVEIPKYVYYDTLFIDFLEEHESAARVVYKDIEQADTFTRIIELIGRLEPAKYELRFMFDWGANSCLWSSNDAAIERYGVGPIDFDELPLSEGLKKQLRTLCDEHDTALDWDCPQNGLVWDEETQSDFFEKARVAYGDIIHELELDYGVSFNKGNII